MRGPSRVLGRKGATVSDPADAVIDELLAVLSPSGGIHPGLARHVGQQLRRLRPPAVDGAALCEPYLRCGPIDGVAISTIGSPFGAATVAASDPLALRLDEIQLELRQGPCWDAIAAAAPVAMVDAGSEDRWPVFSEAVGAIDIRAVFAFPLVVAGLPVGAVDLYSRTAGPLGEGLVEELAARTARTSLGVLSAVVPASGRDDLGEARAPESLRRASDILATRYRTSPRDALLLLRAHALADDRSVDAVAEEIVSDADAVTAGPRTTRTRAR